MKKWGEGASLIRKEWKARGDKMGDDDDEDEDDSDEDEKGGIKGRTETGDQEATPRIPKKALSPTIKTFDQLQEKSGVDELTQSLNTLSLVPNSVRFGRGAKVRGFAHEQKGGYRGRGAAPSTNSTPNLHQESMEVDQSPQRGRGSFRGRRARGRARGL